MDNIAEAAFEAETEDEVLVSLRNVSVKYAGEKCDVLALQDINLDINKGEFICVLGPSGCGKSTLLNIIAGFHQPTEGTVTMGGMPIKGLDWKKGVMFQTPTIYPWFDIYENVAFWLKMSKVDENKIASRVESSLELTGLKDFKQKRPYELSEYRRQCVTLARVLANQHDIILMDNPFSALNAAERANMQSLLRKILQKLGTAFFLITNSVDEALTLATRVIIMSARPGHIVHEFRTDFTYDNQNRESLKYSEEYTQTRWKIINAYNAVLSSTEV